MTGSVVGIHFGRRSTGDASELSQLNDHALQSQAQAQRRSTMLRVPSATRRLPSIPRMPKPPGRHRVDASELAGSPRASRTCIRRNPANINRALFAKPPCLIASDTIDTRHAGRCTCRRGQPSRRCLGRMHALQKFLPFFQSSRGRTIRGAGRGGRRGPRRSVSGTLTDVAIR